MANDLIDISVPLHKRRARRSRREAIHDPVHRSSKAAALPAVLRRVEGGGFAGWAGLGVSKCSSQPTTVPISMRPGTLPTMNRGERSWTIDEGALDGACRAGRETGFSALPDAMWQRQRMSNRAQAHRPHAFTSGDRRGQYQRRGQIRPTGYVNSGLRHGYEATMYLLERGVRLTGIDGWSWDAPSFTPRRIRRDQGRQSDLGEATRPVATSATATSKSAQPEQLPSNRFTVSCFGEDRTGVRGLDPG